MAYRDGSGNTYSDLAELIKQLKKENRSLSVYASKKDWDSFEEDFGDKIASDKDCTLYDHASIKDTARGGSYKIILNCVYLKRGTGGTYWAGKSRYKEAAAHWEFLKLDIKKLPKEVTGGTMDVIGIYTKEWVESDFDLDAVESLITSVAQANKPVKVKYLMGGGLLLVYMGDLISEDDEAILKHINELPEWEGTFDSYL